MNSYVTLNGEGFIKFARLGSENLKIEQELLVALLANLTRIVTGVWAVSRSEAALGALHIHGS